MARLPITLATLACLALALLPPAPAEAAHATPRSRAAQAQAARAQPHAARTGWTKARWVRGVRARAASPRAPHARPAGRLARRHAASRPAALAVTGRYGPATVASVRRYQAIHGLFVSGVADRRTLWSLGLVLPHTVYPGQAGNGVRALQRALRHHERFSPPIGRAPRPHRTRPAPGHLPRPVWTPPAEPFPLLEAPVLPAPISAPPSAPPVPVPEAPPSRPWLELRGAGWSAPVPAGGPPALFGAGGALWLGDWGVAGEYGLAPDLGKQAPGDLIDAQLRLRALGPVWLGLGYRGFAGEHLGAGALGLDQPLGADWLRLRAAATGGSNFGAGWVADGRGGLALVLGPLALEGGYQALAADAVGGLPGMGLGHGTYAHAGLRF